MLPPMRIDPTKPCFLDLPGEIRNQIYDHIRKNHFEDIRRNPRQPDVYNNVFGRYRNILKLNKTIHREAASWLWGNYVVSIHKDIVNLESFLRVMPTNASYVEDIALIDFFGMGSNQSPVQDWKKRRWSMVEIHEAHSNTLASLPNLQRIWFRWDTHYIDLDYLSWCIHITIRKWMARFGNAEDQSVALESHVRFVHRFVFVRNRWQNIHREMIERLQGLIDSAPVSMRLRSATGARPGTGGDTSSSRPAVCEDCVFLRGVFLCMKP